MQVEGDHANDATGVSLVLMVTRSQAVSYRLLRAITRLTKNKAARRSWILHALHEHVQVGDANRACLSLLEYYQYKAACEGPKDMGLQWVVDTKVGVEITRAYRFVNRAI